jgi:hypothetical protein
VIVCSRSFVKTFEKTPGSELSAAREIRNRYLAAVRGARLTVEDGSDLVRRKT